MADVIRLSLAVAPVVSLYVNDYNERALRTYARVGFHTVGEFATVLF
jgi:predicted GNAT family acetyltransferase